MAILEDLETSKCKNGPPNDLFYGFPGEKDFGRWDKNSYIYPCFMMFYKIFLSPQVKLCAIITYKHGIYELPTSCGTS